MNVLKAINGRVAFCFITLSLCLTTTIPVFASDRSMRCGTHLIHAGGLDSPGLYEVFKKCGEPEAKHGYTWIYLQGNMRRILTFNAQGRLMRIESRRD